MPGMPITDRQVRRYMEQRRLGATQVVAAAKAGFSERIKALERENRELRQANEILRKASAYPRGSHRGV